MRRIRFLALGALVVLALAQTPAQAHWGVGIRIGVPICVGPWWYPCYRPYPVYVAPAPVYVAAPPVIVQPAPVVQVAPPPQTAVQASAPPLPAQPTPVVQVAAPVSVRAQAPPVDRQLEISGQLQRLSNPDERVRADAAIQLGRMRAVTAIDPLAATLAGDISATVREAAARGLGLIGSPRALPALEHAAQADSDREVRHSADFAAEVVRPR